jgi:alpha-mannosidase
MSALYFMDGYHGGIRGHMPLGAWRDILDQMKLRPQWRLSIDVEPVSWDYLKERDPESYAEFAALVKDNADNARVEIVAGSYAQPYGWITDGESNIRHLTMGLAILKKHFPDTAVDTYAVQEPCWTSALPQILRQLGFKRASLKDASTAWGGYAEGYPAQTVDWTGPDGTSIPTAPRYHCEALVNVYETEARAALPDYVKKCVGEGIEYPTGMYYQDLGWAARPGMSGEDGTTPEYVQYSTWRDYFNNVAREDRPVWQPGQEIFAGALPWGERVLVRMARQVRRLETAMLDVERVCAVAGLVGGYTPGDRLDEAWGHLLMTQHHDGWICAGAGTGERSWAWKTSAQVYAAEFILDKLMRDAFASAARGIPAAECSGEGLLVVNPLAREESRIVRASMTSAIGTRGFDVFDGDELLPSQFVAQRKHNDGSLNAGELLFQARLPALGVKTFRVVPREYETGRLDSIRAELRGRIVLMENRHYRVEIDLDQGGVIRSYMDLSRGVEIVPDGARFNEYKGYFIKEDRFCSNAEYPAEAEIAYVGALEARVIVRGRIAGTRFEQRYTVAADSSRLDVAVSFDFGEETLVGEPYHMEREYTDESGRHYDPHRTYHDGRYRLNAYFPTAFEQRHIDKDCAYDVCRSALDNTHFKTWNEIKHNILLHWVDASDGGQGVCVLCDHTTAYTHGGDEPLGLTLAWGYDAGFWWGRRPLKGIHTLRYQIMAHSGDWRGAGIWHECEMFLHQPLARRGARPFANYCESVFGIRTDGVELGSAYVYNGSTYVRVFNAGGARDAVFAIDADRFSGMEETAPDGAPTGREYIIDVGGGNTGVRIALPEYAIRTYRLVDKKRDS